MTSAVRDSEWDESPVCHRGARLRYVYRRPPNGVWAPWLVVAPSALLRRRGLEGLGLYAARGFRCGSYVGKYAGRRVGWWATRAAAYAAPQVARLARRGAPRAKVPRGRL